MRKLLSVNVPTFNRARYLQALIDSISNDLLELGNIVEINIIDNCSTDETAQVAETLASEFPCIAYHRNEKNIGAIANIHKAHRVGTGEYLWVMGDDDYLVGDGLARIVRSLSSKPAAVLLSYSRVTPAGQSINDVSIGEVDAVFTIGSEPNLVRRVDPLVGFISANIVDRSFADEVSDEEFLKLDRVGELAHSAIMYRAMASGREVHYFAGQPLVQTADNGYLRHDYWMHVCVHYCLELPRYLSTMGYRETQVDIYFRRRLWKESVRRVLSEKYRKKTPFAVVQAPSIRQALGFKLLILYALCAIPSIVIKSVYDFLKPARA
jgi:glycosyltransferase involved in cell wall biosynthesis